MESLIKGKGRIAICDKIYKDIEECREWEEHTRGGAPDLARKVIVNAVTKNTQETFGAESLKDDNYKKMQKQRN